MCIHTHTNTYTQGHIHVYFLLRHVTGLWARPVIRYRPVTESYRITTSPARAGTGEPLHRLAKSVGLYYPTQRTHIQLNMSSEVRV